MESPSICIVRYEVWYVIECSLPEQVWKRHTPTPPRRKPANTGNLVVFVRCALPSALALQQLHPEAEFPAFPCSYPDDTQKMQVSHAAGALRARSARAVDSSTILPLGGCRMVGTSFAPTNTLRKRTSVVPSLRPRCQWVLVCKNAWPALKV